MVCCVYIIQTARMPTSQDLAIFVLTTDKGSNCYISCTCVQGNKFRWCINDQNLALALKYADNLYLHLSYFAHEQKAHGLQVIGVANKNTVFVTLVDLAKRIMKPIFRRFRQVRCIYGSFRCLGLAIWQFSWWQQTDRQQIILIALPLAHVHRVIMPTVLTSFLETFSPHPFGQAMMTRLHSCFMWS